VAHDTQNADSQVRDYIHAWTVDQVSRWENNALNDGDVKFARYVRKSWQPRIDALYEGRAVLISRFELPREHPMSPKWGGNPGDHLELTADDRVRLYEGPPEPKLRLNRTERRRAGWRGPGLNGQS
jgi:hypothetical protein